MTLRPRWTRTSFIFGGIGLWGLVLIGCVSVNRTVLAPPKIAGAEFVGSKQCSECHSDLTDHFSSASHAKLAIADPKVGDTGCEACHGPGSLHVKSGGERGTIVNPKADPASCFQCHLDKRGEFSLPDSHPVMAGHVSCVDCHDVHGGNGIKGALALATQNENCTNCHTQQQGPFVFEHGAMREGCTACHNPHGSVNQKMLIARDGNLCLRCHLETATAAGQINAGGMRSRDHAGFLMRGTCWSAGCHEAVHGSNTSNHLRR